jgi:hypothetical protein
LLDREGTDLLHTVNVLNPAHSRSLFDQSVSKAQCSDGRETVVGLPCSNDMSTDTHNTVDKHTDDSINPLDHSVFEFKNNNVRENKEVVGKVWEYCGGLPLAIVTMAGLFPATQNKMMCIGVEFSRIFFQRRWLLLPWMESQGYWIIATIICLQNSGPARCT